MASDTFFQELHRILPAFVTRKEIGKHLGHIISPRYLANLDSLGKGPQRVQMGRKVVYQREDLIAWLESRITINAKCITT